jgi:hypothetical protein
MPGFFSKKFIIHLATELNVEPEDILLAVNSYGESYPKSQEEQVLPSKKVLPPKKVGEKKEIPKKEVLTINKCERIKRGKEEPCGSNAKLSIKSEDGVEHWYCGTLKSGCYNSILGASKRQTKTVPLNTTKSENVGNKPKSNEPMKVKKDFTNVKSKSLLNSVIQKKDLIIKSIEIKNGKLWIDHATRILFDRKTEEAYGLLDEDNETILELSDKYIRLLEASNILIKKKVNKKESSVKNSTPVEVVDEDDHEVEDVVDDDEVEDIVDDDEVDDDDEVEDEVDDDDEVEDEVDDDEVDEDDE